MPHIHEKYDFTVSVYIVFDGKVLLVNHPRYGLWIPVGGHVEMDEDPEQTLLREIKEETGLEVDILSSKSQVKSAAKNLYTPNYMDVHDANPPHRHIDLKYFARAHSADSVRSEEHEDMRWFSTEDLEEPVYNLSPGVKFYAAEAIKAATGS